MENGFVLSIIYQGYDVVSLGIEKVVLQNGKLIVCYAQAVKMSGVTFTGNYHLALLVDDCDFESVMLFEDGSRIMLPSITEVHCD